MVKRVNPEGGGTFLGNQTSDVWLIMLALLARVQGQGLNINTALLTSQKHILLTSHHDLRKYKDFCEKKDVSKYAATINSVHNDWIQNSLNSNY